MAGRCNCVKGCSCCVQSSDSIDSAGSGAPGYCYQFGVRFSTDAGNQARAGADGGVFAQACLIGPDAQPIVPDPDTGCSTVPPPIILGYDGHPIPPVDGGVQLPPAAAPAYACGLQTDEDGVLSVQTPGTWPLIDMTGAPFEGLYTDAGELFCDPDGSLRGLPDHTAVNVATSGTLLAPTIQVVAGTFDTAASPPLTVTSPSNARVFVGVAFAVLTVDLVAPPNAGALVRHQIRIDGGSWITVRELRWPEGQSGSVDIRSQLELSARASASLNPGDTWTIESRCEVNKSGSGSSPTLVSVTAATQFIGATV